MQPDLSEATYQISGLDSDPSTSAMVTFGSTISYPFRKILLGAVSATYQQLCLLGHDIEQIRISHRNSLTLMIEYGDQTLAERRAYIPLEVLGDVYSSVIKSFQSKPWPQNVKDQMLTLAGKRFAAQLILVQGQLLANSENVGSSKV